MFKKFFAGLVLALASVGSASAEFIIDSFNASQPNGHAAQRSIFTTAGASVVQNGTNTTISLTNFTDYATIGYTFTGPISGFGSSLNTLRLDLLGLDTGYNITASLFNGGTFNGSGFFTGGTSLGGNPFTSIGANSSTNASLANLGSANRVLLVFQLSSFTGGSVTLDRLTATPEPTSMLMLGSCLGAGWYARRRMVKSKKPANA